MAQITYDDKSAINVNSSVPNNNKVTANDMNEIKSVVNSNYEEYSRRGDFICCTLSSNQSLTSTAETTVKLNTELSKRGTGFTLSNNIITCHFTGYVEISGQIQFSNATSTNPHNIYIYQNNSVIARSLNAAYTNGGNKASWCTPVIVAVSENDTFKLNCYGTSGEAVASTNNSTHLTIRRV